MLTIPTVIILAALSQAPISGTPDQALPVYQCDFEYESDLNYDGWPDDWSRKTGRGFPQYLRVKIERESAEDPKSNRRLVVHMDGGAAAAFTARTPVHSRFSYFIQARVRLRDFKHDAAFISVRFYDAKEQLLEIRTSEKVRLADDWTKLTIGPLAPQSEHTASAVIGVHAEPVGEDYDIFATAEFDDLSIVKIPNLSLRGNRKDLIFTDPKQVSVTCDLSGTLSRNAKINFEATDITGKIVDQAEMPTTGSPIFLETASNQDDGPIVKKTAGFHFTQTWSPTLPGYGFYRFRVTVTADEAVPLQKTINAVVIREIGGRTSADFGWSIQRDAPVAPKELVQLLSQAGVGWVKYPMWYASDNTETADTLAWFAERLGNRGIKIVGVLDRPPVSGASELFGDRAELPSAFVFSEKEVWTELVNPIVTRLSMKVRYWQLGSDDDLSYVGFPDIAETIQGVKEHLERFGQDVDVGVAWRWINEKPKTAIEPWSFFSNVSDPPLTANELVSYLDAAPKARKSQWVMLRPLAASQFDLDTRVRDLLVRMIAAKVGHAGVTFIAKPFDNEEGVMQSDGSPGELLLPWRTGTRVLAGTEYVGTMQLPQGSQNRVFADGDKAVIALWNDKPTEEVLYLGDEKLVHIVDVWGRVYQPPTETIDGVTRQRIQVGQLPLFVLDADLNVAKWRLSCKLDRTRLASIFGREQVVRMAYRNSYEQGVSGEVNLRTPAVWSVAPAKARFKAQAAEMNELPVNVFLQANATSGEQQIRFDFKIHADTTYNFSVYRNLQVGLGDVKFELNSFVDETGSLVVEQHLVNSLDSEVSFNCILFTPSGRQRRQVLNATRGRRVDTYRFEEGEDLVGKRLWLRAEEIGGTRRILNHQIQAER
jgi:hypothetical protein